MLFVKILILLSEEISVTALIFHQNYPFKFNDIHTHICIMNKEANPERDRDPKSERQKQ